MSFFGDIFSGIGSLASSAGSLVGDIPSSIIGSAISGGASLLGGINQQATATANVQQQEQFQEAERLSAYPDTVKSLEDAGLNPVLAATQGPLSTPTGAMFNPQNILGGAATSAMQGYTQQAQLDNLQKQGDLLSSQKAQADTQADLNDALKSKAANDALNSAYDATQRGMTIKSQVDAANSEAAAEAAENRVKSSLFNDPVGKGIMSAGEMIRNFFSPLSHSAVQVGKQVPY